MAKQMLRFSFFALILGFSLTTTAQKKIKTIIIDAGHGYKGPNKTSPDGAPGRLCNEDDVALAVSLKLQALINKTYPALTVVQTRPDDDFVYLATRSKIANDNKGDLFICIHVNDADTHKERVIDYYKTVTKMRTEKDSSGKKIQVPYEAEEPVYKWQRIGCSAFGGQSYVMNPKNIGVKLTKAKNGINDEDTSLKNVSSIQAQLNVKKYFKKSVEMSLFVQNEFKALNRKFGSGDAIYQRPKGIHVLEATNMPSLLIETGFICNDKDEKYLCSNAGQQELAEAIMRAFVKYKTKFEPAGTNDNVTIDTPKPSLTPQPVGLKKRTNNLIKTLNVQDENITLSFYDDGVEDGDIITVLFNGVIVANQQRLSTDPVVLQLKANKGINEIVMYSNSQGTIPPNTALLKIRADKRDVRINMASDEKANGIIYIRKD